MTDVTSREQNHEDVTDVTVESEVSDSGHDFHFTDDTRRSVGEEVERLLNVMKESSSAPKRPQKVADQRHDMANRRKAVFLEAVRAGKTQTEARALAGWKTTQAVTDARKRDPEWAAALDDAKVAGYKVRMLGEIAQAEADSLPSNFSEFTRWAFNRSHLAHQLRIADVIGSVQPGEIVLILTWRGSGKTTTVEDKICETLAKDSSARFCLVSKADGHATRMIGKIQRQLTDTYQYPEFIGRYGPFYEEGQTRRGFPWSTHELRIATRRDDERDPSVIARGWRSAAFGSRIDWLIVDDVIDKENVAQSQAILETLRQTFFSSELGMRTVIIGNRIEPGDLYDLLIDENLISRVVVIPATGGFGHPPGEATVPQWWESKIAKENIAHRNQGCCPGRDCPNDGSLLSVPEAVEMFKHRMGERIWSATFLQNPVADGLTAFGSLVDRCLDETRSYGPVPA